MQTYYLHPVNESQAAYIQELHMCNGREEKFTTRRNAYFIAAREISAFG